MNPYKVNPFIPHAPSKHITPEIRAAVEAALDVAEFAANEAVNEWHGATHRVAVFNATYAAVLSHKLMQAK